MNQLNADSEQNVKDEKNSANVLNFFYNFILDVNHGMRESSSSMPVMVMMFVMGDDLIETKREKEKRESK